MFWILVVLLTVVALAFVLPPLLRKVDNIEDDRREQNIAIAKIQLAELEVEFKEGRIEEISYMSSKEELEQDLYNDLEFEEDRGEGKSLFGQKATAIAVALFVPVLAGGAYYSLGTPEALAESNVGKAGHAEANLSGKQKKQLASIESMVGALEDKLKKEPNNTEGWIMLGRTYMVLNRYDDAARAYESANKLEAGNPDILLPMADALATGNKGVLTGRPEELIKQALQKNPESIMGLWLAGMAAEQRSANSEAIAHWKKLEKIMGPTSPDVKEVRALIVRAGGTPEPLAATSPAPQVTPVVPAQAVTTEADSVVKDATSQAITVTVSLSDALKAQVKPEDTVFIYAKAVSGPPMPLAAVRKQVKDLPLEVKLDDSMAMMPQMKLSGFSDVKVGARISLGGTPQAQAGDLFAEKSPVKAGESIQLDINQVVSQ